MATPTTDTFGMSPEFIAKQQEKFGNTPAPTTPTTTPAPTTTWAVPSTVLNTPAQAPVQAPTTPVVPATPTTPTTPAQTPVDNKPATPSTVAPTTPVVPKEEKPVQVDNKALEFNKAVDANRKQGMNEQDAYQTAYRTLIKPTVKDLRASVPDTGKLPTADERRAQFENTKLQRYNAMTPDQLFSEMKKGWITPKLATELQASPAYQQAKQKYDGYKQVENINANTSSLLGTAKPKDPLADLSNTLVNLFSQQGGSDSVGVFRQYISQNPTITSKTAEYNQKAAEKMELERARQNVLKDLKAQHAGLPLSTLLAMAGRETEPLNEQINTLNDSLSILSSEIKQETEFATKEYDIYREEVAAQQAKQAKLQEVLANLAISDYQTNRSQQFDLAKMQAGQQFDLQKMDIQNKFQADRDVNNYVMDLNKLGIQNEYDLQKALQNQGFQKEILALNQKYESSRSVRDFQNDLTKLGFQFDLAQRQKALDLTNEKEMLDYKASLDPDLAAKWEAVRAKATENSSLADLYGKNVGTYEGNRWYDLAGKLWDAIVAPPGAKVIAIHAVEWDGTVSVFEEWKGAMSKKDPGWGNSVLLQLPDGSKMRLSHLQDISVNLGETLAGGQALWTRGNTGNVLGKNGETLTAEQKAAGRGAHVDVEIFDPSGKLLSQSQQLEFLKSVKPFGGTKVAQLTDSDIQTFNNPTFKPADIKDSATKQKFEQYVEKKNELKKAKDPSIDELLAFSAGGKDLWAEEVKALSKFDQALGQVGAIQEQIKDMSTWPILWRLRNMNPYDTDAQVLKAQLSSLIPNLARWVYGEVGVLTDQDIVNYAKTIPNLTSTDDVNKLVLAMTLDTIAWGYKKQLQTLAASWRDVSGFVGLYSQIKWEAENLKQSLTTQNDVTDAYLQSLNQ